MVLRSFELEHIPDKRVKTVGEFTLDGKERKIAGEGNGPLSSVVACLHQAIEGTLAVREYSEHALGVGPDVGAVSYVEFTYEVDGKKSAAWGANADEDIAASGLKAVMAAASRIGVVWKQN